VQDKELYQQILGLDSPWSVSDIELDHERSEVRVRVEHPQGTRFCCPECHAELPCYDHLRERQWRHLDTCQYKTILVARAPRVKCPDHGVVMAQVPWAEKHSRFTMLFERFAIDVLHSTQTVKGAMKILGTKWDQTWSIIERAVQRGKDRKLIKLLPRLGIDEKAFKKGHSYVTVLFDVILFHLLVPGG
jgi:transposase